MPAMARLTVGVLGLSHDHVWANLAAIADGEHGRLGGGQALPNRGGIQPPRDLLFSGFYLLTPSS